MIPRCILLVVIGLSACRESRAPEKDKPGATNSVSQRKGKLPRLPASGPVAQQVRYQQAKGLLRTGKPLAAVKMFKTAIKADPRGTLVVNCYLGLGAAHGDLGQHLRAVEAYRKVTGLAPNDPEAHRALAIGLTDAGKYREARGALTRSVELDPGQLSAYQDLGSLALRLKDNEGAKNAYLRYELTRTRLIRSLGLSREIKVRVAAAQALGEARDEATTKALGLALTDSSREVRAAVILALGRQGLSGGVGPLKALLARSTDVEEKRLIKISVRAIESTPQPGSSKSPTSATAVPR